jgi:regulatory protein
VAGPEPQERAAAGPGERLRVDLLRYLEIRERTCQELVRHLEKRGHDPAAVASEVRAAAAAGWVDDRRFAAVFLRDRRRLHPMSAALVVRELVRRGVSTAEARAALAASDPPWDEREVARCAVARRWERWPASERRRKAASFLRRRGFAGGVIWAVLDELDRHERGSQGDPTI